MPIKLNKSTEVKKTKADELKKSIVTGENGQPVNFHWKNDEAKEFIDYIVDESAGLLAKFRVVQMTGPTKEVAKVVDGGKFLKPGGSYKRTHGNTGADGYQFGADSFTLTAKKVEGMVYISDDELDDNIEGKAWEQHVKQMVAKKIANELVEVAIYGRKLDNPSHVNGILNVYDGVKYIAEQLGNVVDAGGQEIARSIIVKAKKLLKTKYRKDVGVLMDSDIKTDLDELYNDPNGNRGNGEIVKNSVSGMSIEEVPLMNSENAVVDTSVTANTSAVTSVGATIINVDGDLTGDINAGDAITVRSGEADEITYTVQAITASQITVSEPVVYEIGASEAVYKSTLTGADFFILNMKNVVIGIQRDIIVEFERLAPDGFKVWYKMKQDIAIENPEAVVLVKNLKSKEI